MVRKCRFKFGPSALFLAAAVVNSTAAGVSNSPVESAHRLRLASDVDARWDHESLAIADNLGKFHHATLDPELQNHLQAFIAERGSPIASVVVIDVATGEVLAMAQGRAPAKWGATEHTALYSRFPAASIFKTVVTTAALEMTGTGPDQAFGLPGGCGSQDITPTATWMYDEGGGPMSLRRAFGKSCNGFFAKLAINQLGIGAITRFAKLFGWESPLPIDVSVDVSKMMPPPVANSTTHTVGRFAAGFGHVGISPMHGAWMANVIANRGQLKPIRILRQSTDDSPNKLTNTPIYSEQTATKLMEMMRSTVHGGTATQTFGRGRYREIAREVGGKTGTLTGRTPAGLTSLFIGLYPVSAPKIAVSSVVVLEDRFHFKAPQLAAEAILSWKQQTERTRQTLR